MPRDNKVRLQKFIAESGICSRRAAEQLIARGKVKVNGAVVREFGVKIDPDKDKVTCNPASPAGRQQPVTGKASKIYLKLNKPRGYVSSCRKFDDKTILELVQDIPDRLYPVGRLDIDSEGLMILTNDGELANQLTHPRYEHEKEYEVLVQEPLTDSAVQKLESGIMLDDQRTLKTQVEQTGAKSFRIIMKEGRKRQIRRMVEAVGNKVVRLKRVRIKSIQLGGLPEGKYQLLTPAEIRSLL